MAGIILAFGFWRLAFGFWSWLLAPGSWLLAALVVGNTSAWVGIGQGPCNPWTAGMKTGILGDVGEPTSVSGTDLACGENKIGSGEDSCAQI